MRLNIPAILLLAMGQACLGQFATAQSSSDSNGVEPLANSKPNVVVFLADDQGYGDLSSTGNQDLVTPNIDGLARDGAFVENFFVCPVCSPTRAEFLTGRYHPRGGVYSTSAGGERLDLDESTIADAFKSAGYATAAFGKWHNGMQAPYHPNTRGFDEFYGFCSGHWGNYFDPVLEHNGRLTRGKGFIVDDVTDQAIRFIEHNRESPFFVYLPYNTPHSPMQVPEKYWQRFKDKTLSQLPANRSAKSKNRKTTALNHSRAALAMCENIDANVGRVLQKLDDLDLANNTIVIYFSDNGPNGRRYNAGLKGIKGSTDEGGVRSPLFVRWPNKIRKNTRVNLISGAIDLYPTLLNLCDISVKSEKPLDGISIAPELLGAKVKRAPRMIFSHWGGRVSVRTQRYRLDHQQKLFDVSQDPGQTTPVKNQPDVEKRLNEAVSNWKQTVLSQLERTPSRFPVGYPGFIATQLPARDAQVTGELKRSNRYPNCSYFGNWKNTEDTITWPVDVLEAGRFKAEVYYCCAQENLGTRIQLSMGENHIDRTIQVANDPPATGAEHDRYVRAESLVKDFKPIELGEIALPRGKGELVLRALEIPGNESIEFRLLMLTPVGPQKQ